MCGIAGIARTALSDEAARTTLARMASCLRHRGPDDEGMVWNARDGVALVHRRLAVRDLSPAGAQPMSSASGRFTIVLNGEIYNTAEVAAPLHAGGWRPRGHSDTEVMLAAFEAWGLEAALPRLAGMFAFALHDRERRVLHLVRDRLGIKPLHWAWCREAGGQSLAFASELRALLQVPGFDRTPNPQAIASMLAHGCVTGDACVWRGASKLAPGHRLELDLTNGTLKEVCWWSAIDAATAGVANPFRGSDADAVDRTGELLERVVREHLASDVPIGCLLSGGVDSATVAAAVRGAEPGAAIAGYTAGFDDAAFDERTNAAHTARALGMPLRELLVRERSMIDAVGRMAEVYDEPFADSSQIPTWLICGEMRKQVTVALSGDGGDEVFGGYHRHVHAAEAWGRGRMVPSPVRRALAGAVTALSPEAWSTIMAPARPLLPRRLRLRSPGESLHKWAGSFGAASEACAYGSLTRLHRSARSHDGWWNASAAERLPDFLRRMQFMDQTGYMVDDVLVKVDRASMAHGLEVRVPLLDHRVVEFGWALPAQMKVRDGRGKWILRQLLARRVPAQVLAAPKTGFAVPVGAWLRGPLRAWADDLLDAARLRRNPFLDTSRVERAWGSLLAGSDAAQHELWCVLMFQSWADHWGVSP